MPTLIVAVSGTITTLLLARAGRSAAASQRAATLHPRPRVLPAALARPLTRALEDAGLEIDAVEAVKWWLLGALVAVVVTLPLGVGALGLAVLGAVVAGPWALRSARRRADRAAATALPALLERVAGELRSGANVHGALTGAATGPLQIDLARVGARVRAGASLSEALAAWTREREAPGVRATAGALALAAAAGGPSAAALDGLAASLRERIGVLAEARALSAQARFSAVVVGAAPAGYLALSALVDRRSLDALLLTPVGRASAVAGIGCELLAMWWMRRILVSVDPA